MSGRPKLDQKRRKSRTLSFRVTEAEFARLSYQAAVTNLSVSQLARKLSLSKAQSLTVITEERCDPALIKELHKIGHNLNQLTKNAHIFGRMSPQIPGLCERIENLIDQAMVEELDR